MLRRELFPFPAEVPVCGGTFKDASQKRTQVEASPTDKQWHTVSFQDGVTRFERRSQKLSCGKLFVWFPQVEQVMRHRSPLCWGRFRGSDIHPAIDRHGVETDDLSSDLTGETDPDGGLPRGGRPGQEPGLLEYGDRESHSEPDREDGAQKNSPALTQGREIGPGALSWIGLGASRETTPRTLRRMPGSRGGSRRSCRTGKPRRHRLHGPCRSLPIRPTAAYRTGTWRR